MTKRNSKLTYEHRIAFEEIVKFIRPRPRLKSIFDHDTLCIGKLLSLLSQRNSNALNILKFFTLTHLAKPKIEIKRT